MTSISSLTSSSTTTSTTSVSSGIGGLVSGLDTDSLVESLSAVAQTKIDTQDQKLQKLEWKQEAYRTVISAMQEFEDTYLDVLSDTYIGSESLFNTTEATSSSEAITVSTTDNSYEGSFTINSITQLATAETVESASAVTADLTSTVTSESIASSISSLSGSSISLTLDGTVKTITFDSTTFADVDTAEELVSTLQDVIDDAFGVTGDTDRVITVSTDASGYLNFTATGSALEINAVDDDTTTLTTLGLTDGQSNTLSTSTELSELTLATALDTSATTYSFTINDVSFSFSSTDSLSDVLSGINSSDAGVTLSYSEITDTFTMTADDTGAGDNIVVEDTSGNLMTALGITGGTVTSGKNAILSVDGQQIIRSSNNITIDGVSVELETTSTEEITVTMEADSSALEDTITQFVEDYNTLIDLINTYVTEDSDSDYAPLTDAQKEEMTDDEISAWEENAKAGILKGDSTLRSIASKLQTAMYSSAVKGGISLLDLGIETADYDENGQLEIDEDALTESLSTYASEIATLFTSDDSGLSATLEDIFDSAISSSGARGSRGSLVEIAGIEDTTSATQCSLYDQITDTEDLIEVLEDRLTAEQERLWAKFTAMETALSNLNTQSSLISSFASS